MWKEGACAVNYGACVKGAVEWDRLQLDRTLFCKLFENPIRIANATPDAVTNNSEEMTKPNLCAIKTQKDENMFGL